MTGRIHGISCYSEHLPFYVWNFISARFRKDSFFWKVYLHRQSFRKLCQPPKRGWTQHSANCHRWIKPQALDSTRVLCLKVISQIIFRIAKTSVLRKTKTVMLKMLSFEWTIAVCFQGFPQVGCQIFKILGSSIKNIKSHFRTLTIYWVFKWKRFSEFQKKILHALLVIRLPRTQNWLNIQSFQLVRLELLRGLLKHACRRNLCSKANGKAFQNIQPRIKGTVTPKRDESLHASQLQKPIKRLLLKLPQQQIIFPTSRKQIIIIVAQAIFSQSLTEHGFKLC